ncbi:MAG: CAP domain-containing protein [Clostridiales bacterium]|nr:CAP domain-containing protein [Clostridiales bacterium]
MNKIGKITSALTCALLISTAPAYAESCYNNVLADKLTTNNSCALSQNSNFIPAENLLDCLGMKAEWDAENKCLYAENGESELSINLNSCELWLNGECINLDSAPFEENGKVFVSAQTICDVLSCIHKFDGINGVVIGSGNILCPTAEPTQTPAVQPTQAPTAEPTQTPAVQPTQTPTVEPTQAPEVQPTHAPTAEPTHAPEVQPTHAPTAEPTQTPAVQPTQAPSNLSDMEQEVLKLVNKVRSENGLSPLAWADDVANVARAHSKDMIDRSFFSHINPDGLSPFDRLKNNGISFRSAAENIAYGQRTAEAVMDAWMNSSGHRANILNKNVTEIGIGAVKNQYGTIYWTQVFVLR